MGVEYGRPERETLDCVEYLGFWPTKDRFVTRDPTETSAEDLRIEPATEVLLEVHGHPEAQVRVYVRPETPTLIILSLLEKIATAIELEQYLHNKREPSQNDEQLESERFTGDEKQGSASCRRCRLSLHEKSSIRDALGLLCIDCARELQML